MAQSWRKALVEKASSYLEWLDSQKHPEHYLAKIANKLQTYLTATIQTPEEALCFWKTIPQVRSACNQPETYEKRFAAEAYAYVHFLDRYWRTWDVLRELTRLCALPLGKDGVRVLDIGTGPGPTPYALQDFYSLLREYGRVYGQELFIGQDLTITIVERSRNMQRFLHYFSEWSRRLGPFGADRYDFSTFDPITERKKLKKSLQSQEWYDSASDEYFLEYTPDEANRIAQRQHRYRFIIFSNFFTVGENVNQLSKQIQCLFSDLQYGGTVIVLGARGSHYRTIYDSLMKLAKASGMHSLPKVETVLGPQSYNHAAQIIKSTQNNIYLYLTKLCGESALPKTREYPDYWNPAPYKGKQTKFALRVYRKGRWPQ
jgi:hypothetical protein